MNTFDDDLLQAMADLYAALDPAPADLADGVLARLAVQDLEAEFELFTLVQPVDTLAGTRHGDEPETSATVALEFAGSAYRVLVRISDTDDGRRLDGWVVPALPMRALLGPQGDALAHTRQSAYADREGRFEFPAAVTGEVRLWLLPQRGRGDGDTVPAFVTPPFLV
ncbi:MAG TPA: hypothetical protein VGK78_05325 [Nocardioides sp.]|uniref:hypothetical protein n=1 Tax=Nocardioides sp. TaxID=35761 RepID=UPI002F3FF4F4